MHSANHSVRPGFNPIPQWIERRAWVGFPGEENSGSAACRDDATCLLAKVRDISSDGIRLVFNRWLKPATKLEVELIQTTSAPSGALLVTVTQSNLQGDGTWLVACAFSRNLSREELDALS